MTSPAQLAANRANAQLSTGPVTEAGKQAAGKNAVVHGLSGRVHAALPGEEEPFARYCREVIEDFAPAGVRERDLAQDIAADRWRLKRARAIENALFAQAETEQSGNLPPAQTQAQAQANAWIDPKKGLQRIALYAARIQRTIDRNTAALDALQSTRKAACAKAREEAVLLTQLAECEGHPYDPEPDFGSAELFGGFVYSAPEIARLIDRARRLEQARALVEPPASLGSALPGRPHGPAGRQR